MNRGAAIPGHRLARIPRETPVKNVSTFVLLAVAAACTGASRPPVVDPRSSTPLTVVGTAEHARTPSCFITDSLPANLRQVSERVLLEAGDGEALYTLAGGLKPLSSGRAISYRIAPSLQTTMLDSLEQLRRATAALTCGDIGAFVHVFTAAQSRSDGQTTRAAEVIVFHRTSVATTVSRHAGFFGTLGITPSADVREVLAAVENASRAARWRGYGLLFGYPEHAVDFFVRAGIKSDSTGTLVPRDFLRIDTFRKFPDGDGQPPTLSSFVYAVPKGAGEQQNDRLLREAAAPVYARYLRERSVHVRPDSSGAIALWTAWLTNVTPSPHRP